MLTVGYKEQQVDELVTYLSKKKKKEITLDKNSEYQSIIDIARFLKVQPKTVKLWVTDYRTGKLSMAKTVSTSKNLRRA